MALSILFPHLFYTFMIQKYAQYFLLWAPKELIECSYDHMGRAPTILRFSRKCFKNSRMFNIFQRITGKNLQFGCKRPSVLYLNIVGHTVLDTKVVQAVSYYTRTWCVCPSHRVDDCETNSDVNLWHRAAPGQESSLESVRLRGHKRDGIGNT